MKSPLFLTVFAAMLILNSCSHNRALNDETARKQLIDSKANEVVERENPEIVDQLLNLDETLNELDKSLQGETGIFTEGIEETNIKLIETNEMLRQLKKNLYNQAEALKRLRLQTIEPITADALVRNEADKQDNQP